MFRRFVGQAWAKLSLAALALMLIETAAYGQAKFGSFGVSDCGVNGSCGVGGNCGVKCAPAHCQRFHCPPALKWCAEGKPRICFQRGCPKPICNPCEAPNWGYYQTCWSPWPWPPDWSHCPVPPPASTVYPGMIPANQGIRIEETGPGPRTLDNRPPL